VVPIRLPPLRECREDIPLLVDHFARRESGRLGRPIRELPEQTLAALRHYDWPGNVRELRNLVERAIVMSPDGVPRLPDVLATGRAVPDREPSCSDVGRASLAELMHRYKSQLIARRWSEAGGTSDARRSCSASTGRA